MVEILNFLKRIQSGIRGMQNIALFHHTRHLKGESDDLESLLRLLNFLEKKHSSLTNVTASQHHTKTVASELNLADLAEKLHASLTGVTSDQHHNQGKLIESFTAGENLLPNETVYISAADTVSKATNANATKGIGVTIEAALSGNPVDVCIGGKATGIANEAISVGDILTPSVVGGRLAILTTNTNSIGSHTHTNPSTSAVASHTHTNPSTSETGAHTHTNPSTSQTGAHAHTQGNTGSSGNHSHTQGVTGSSGNHSHTQGVTGSNGDHYHTQGNTGTANINHRHGIGTSSVATGAGSAHSHSYSKTFTPTGIPSATQTAVTALEFQNCPDGHTVCQMSTKSLGPVAHESHTHPLSFSTTSSGDESSHTHNYEKVSSLSDYANPSHDHTNPNTSTNGAHTHTNPSTSEVASHTHTNPSTSETGAHTHTNPNTSETGAHTHTQGNTGSSGNHSHTQGVTGSSGNHSHTQGVTGSSGDHAHTTNIGKVLAKAITAAANPGDTFSIIVCLGG